MSEIYNFYFKGAFAAGQTLVQSFFQVFYACYKGAFKKDTS